MIEKYFKKTDTSNEKINWWRWNKLQNIRDWLSNYVLTKLINCLQLHCCLWVGTRAPGVRIGAHVSDLLPTGETWYCNHFASIRVRCLLFIVQKCSRQKPCRQVSLEEALWPLLPSPLHFKASAGREGQSTLNFTYLIICMCFWYNRVFTRVEVDTALVP